MLEGLLGSKAVEKILLFLFVNEKGYGTQMGKLLEVPLTPIQNGLSRLEKYRVVLSQEEGKRKVYRFNPSYPFRSELENLLKKAYTLLPADEKKRYCFVHKPRLSLQAERRRDRGRKKELAAFWERLTEVTRLSVVAKSRELEEEQRKEGKAVVEVFSPTATTILFEEKGIWSIEPLADTEFTNRFRWTLDRESSLITLEHLRYGASHPVFLFHLTPTKPGVIESVDAHLCGEDTYLGHILWDPKSVVFNWRIIGPKKNTHLVYLYK